MVFFYLLESFLLEAVDYLHCEIIQFSLSPTAHLPFRLNIRVFALRSTASSRSCREVACSSMNCAEEGITKGIRYPTSACSCARSSESASARE